MFFNGQGRNGFYIGIPWGRAWMRVRVSWQGFGGMGSGLRTWRFFLLPESPRLLCV